MTNLEQFYSGKDVCITGGCGMVGSHLANLLSVRYGARVFVLDDMSRGKNVHKGMHQVFRADAGDENWCEYAFGYGDTTVDAVFNLAASVAGVMHNMDHHYDMFLQNARLQTVPLGVADRLGVKHFLQVSSVCIYDPQYNSPSIENFGDMGHPHPANGGYAWSKRVGERLVELSNLDHAVIVRPSNIFGTNDYFDERAHVIPALIKRAYEEGDTLKVYGDPEVTREFIYVKDAAEGMAFALANGENKEAYNLGWGGKRISMAGLAQMILDITRQDKTIVFDSGKGGGDMHRFSNTDKMESLGWKPSIDFEEGLRRTIRWYENTHLNQ